jgi:hypothetical protein
MRAQTSIVSRDLLRLLELLGLYHDGTLESIVEATQNAWLRSSNTERWQLAAINYNAEKEIAIKNLLEKLGFTSERPPALSHYTYVILLASSVDDMCRRFAYLIDLWDKRIQFDRLICLAGSRPLDPLYESPELTYRSAETFLGIKNLELSRNKKTEDSIMTWLYENAQLPQTLRKLPTTFVLTPMLKQSDGTVKRPTTAHTFHSWLETRPKKGTCLIVSNQPFVLYQHSVAQTELRDFTVDTVGPDASLPLIVSEALDSVARWLFQEQLRLKQSTGHEM